MNCSDDDVPSWSISVGGIRLASPRSVGVGMAVAILYQSAPASENRSRRAGACRGSNLVLFFFGRASSSRPGWSAVGCMLQTGSHLGTRLEGAGGIRTDFPGGLPIQY